MKIVRKILRQNKFIQYLYYKLSVDNLKVICNTKTYVQEINSCIKKSFSLDSSKEKSIIKDIKNCYLKYKISPTEYFLYDFINKTNEERSTYLADKLIYMTMAQTTGRKVHDDELENKFNFYKIVGEFFQRDVCCVRADSDFNEFARFALKHKRFILKPNDSACGHGIKIVTIEKDEDIKSEFVKMINSSTDYIVEELIKQAKEMAEWNESSVNTIRISSFINNSGFHLLCPFMRMGRKGSIVDNGGLGGTYCSIDPKSGIIITDGKDENNNKYINHPDSGIIYKGWQVPKWNELICLVEKIHMKMSNHRYIAWDFALSDKGWVLVEGNWGQFVAQQSTMERGYKKEFFELING